MAAAGRDQARAARGAAPRVRRVPAPPGRGEVRPDRHTGPQPPDARAGRAGRGALPTTGSPRGHGFTARNRADGTAYYSFDRGPVTFVVLDTVEPSGGPGARSTAPSSRGCAPSSTVPEAGSSCWRATTDPHHDVRGPGRFARARRRGAGRCAGASATSSPGSTGTSTATRCGHAPVPTDGGLWEVTSASHVDWPQQSRLVEIVRQPRRDAVDLLDDARPRGPRELRRQPVRPGGPGRSVA